MGGCPSISLRGRHRWGSGESLNKKKKNEPGVEPGSFAA